MTKKYHHGNLRQALIEAGLQMLDEGGLESLTLRSVAARVGVSHTAPKNHFPSLTDLRSAIAAVGFDRHRDYMLRGIGPDSPRRDRLAAAMTGYVDFARDHPGLFGLMFSPALLDYSDAALSGPAQASRQVLEDISEGLGWPKADLGAKDLRTEWMLWSFVHGYAHLMTSGQLTRTGETAPALSVRDVFPDFVYSAEG